MQDSQHLSDVLPQIVTNQLESIQLDNYCNQPIVNGKYPDGTFAPGHQIESPRHPMYRETSWKEGQSGNPAGRPEGALNLSTPWFTGNLETKDIEKLETMSKPELIRLLKTLGGVVGYALKNPEEKAEAAELKLYGLGMQANEVHKVIPALKEWYDRTKGKPAQSIQMTVKDEGLDKLATDKLLRLAAMLDEPVTIAPLPKKLEE